MTARQEKRLTRIENSIINNLNPTLSYSNYWFSLKQIAKSEQNSIGVKPLIKNKYYVPQGGIEPPTWLGEARSDDAAVTAASATAAMTD